MRQDNSYSTFSLSPHCDFRYDEYMYICIYHTWKKNQISGLCNDEYTCVYFIPGKKIRFQVMTNINMYISCLEKNFNEAGTKKWHLRFGLKFTFDFWLVLAIWRRLLPLFGPLTQATSCLDTDLFKGMTYIHMLLLLLSRQKKEGSCKIYAYISRDFF